MELLNIENMSIANIIEQNPLKNLLNKDNNKLIEKISEYYTTEEHKTFLSIFYCYLNYDEKIDIVIDLDLIWRILGFSQKDRAKKLLVSNFNENIDYKILSAQEIEKKKGIGGYNIQKIFLTVKTFKLLSVKSCNREADNVYEYYINLEKIVDKLINESQNIEANELKIKLEQKENEIKEKENKINEVEQQKILAIKEKEMIREKTILEQFNENMQCVYYGFIDNKSTKDEPLIKFGNSNNLRKRVEDHKKTYDNFRLVNAFKVSNKLQIENGIKTHPKLKNKRRNILINNINYTELLSLKDITLKEVDEEIKDIIDTYEYNRENYLKVVERNNELENELTKMEDETKILNDKINILENKLEEYSPSDISSIRSSTKLPDFHTTKNGFIMYVYEIKKNRYICGVIRPAYYEHRLSMLHLYENGGKMIYTREIKYVFTEKIMIFLLKERLIKINFETFDGSIDDIKHIFDICNKIEELIVNKNESLETIMDTLNNISCLHNNLLNIENDPEEPSVRKAKRAVEQINPTTMTSIASFESLESAGRALNVTGNAIGISLRNKTLCKGFLWRYAGISHEDQFTNQPVIKIKCYDGTKTEFNTIADAAKDAGISAPGLRSRILTHVHKDGHHWIFAKNSTHYK